MKPTVAPALRPGDTIALVAPAGPLDRERIERAIERFEQLDFVVKTYGDIYRSRGYLAGNDDARAAELNAALADPDVAAVMPARGGYGVTRILDRLNFAALAEHPKIVTGFSDITALHSAIHQATGLVTFHSPNPMDGLGMPDGLSNLSARTFWRAVLASEYDNASSPGYVVPLTDEELQKITTLSPSVARGAIVGGNLALISAMQGTPYEIEMHGRILLIEEVGEPSYRIDRMLSQLRLAGKLDELAGVVLGELVDCDPLGNKPSLSPQEIFDDYFAPLQIPVVQNYPVGHGRNNATLPLGVEVELDADARRVTLLENPVSP